MGQSNSKPEHFDSPLSRHRGAIFSLLGVATVAIIVSATVLRQSDAQPTITATEGPALSDIELLGKHIFFDKISDPQRMSCSTCHNPAAGWTGGISGKNLHEVAMTGADPHTVGTLKPPLNAYASLIERFQPCTRGGSGLPLFCGGNFWNGRSIGFGGDQTGTPTEVINPDVIDSAANLTAELKAKYKTYLIPTSDQALNPFPNHVEQNINEREVCEAVAAAKYAKLFELAWGEPVNCVATAYQPAPSYLAYQVTFRRIALSIGAWQTSADVNSFTSKRDIALQREREGIDVDSTPGKFPLVSLTAQENFGHDLFYATFFRPVIVNGAPKFGNCTLCHLSSGVAPDGTDPKERYTDDAYHAIGTPFNPEIPGNPGPNPGLASHTQITPNHTGFFKTPSLRNVDKRPDPDFIKAYSHNGWFKSLESIVHFYNTAAIGGATAARFNIKRCPPEITTEKDARKANCWPAPEWPNAAGAIPFIIGNLNLTLEEEAAIVAYLKTFSDTYTPRQPPPYK